MSDDQQNEKNETGEENTFEKLQTDLTQAIEGWKRTAADFENYKRRKEEEGRELVAFAREVTVAKLLPILDTLEQALRHAPVIVDQQTSEFDSQFSTQYANWQKGINGIVMQLDGALGELGVQKIEAIPNKTKFNPHLHEAVRHLPRSQEWEGIIAEELQVGYKLNEKIIRPSMVTVYSEKSEEIEKNKFDAAGN